MGAFVIVYKILIGGVIILASVGTPPEAIDMGGAIVDNDEKNKIKYIVTLLLLIAIFI